MRATARPVARPSRDPWRSARSQRACAAVIAADAVAVPMTGPATPNGLYRANDTRRFRTMLAAARAVGVHGRCREKNVRVSRRLMPANGSENENQNSAVDTRSVEWALNAPRW